MAEDNNMFQGEMDPEIAALLGAEVKPKAPGAPAADFASVFDDALPEGGEAPQEGVDLTAGGFPEITKRFESIPIEAFNDPNYYKVALSGEGDISQRVHTILQKYLNAKDPKDKGVFRQQFILAYWDFLINVARRAPGKLPDPKKYLLRFGIIHPTFLDGENRALFSKFVTNDYLNQPVYYLDEWFKNVGTGIIRNSSTDEVRVAKNNNAIRVQQLLDKAQGKLDGARSLLRAKDEERINQEQILTDRVQQILEHFPVEGLRDISGCYSESQKRTFGEIMEILKGLLKVDHDFDLFLKEYYQAEQDVKTLHDKVEEEGGSAAVDIKAVDTEFETVKQMAKLTIGRQGNHFPILSSEYFHCMPNDIGYRENVVSIMAWIESIDAEAFCRSHRNRLMRIIPYVVLLPTYGDSGMCWEPFDRFNRATGRGRLAVPMYSKSLQTAMLSAVGDLRWQVAKEKASRFWMDEGITGSYYQWFTKMKLRGDLKEAFISDYITWVLKESEGTQKLDKELRKEFWRYMPFTKPIKEKLKNRSYLYQELYQRDVNRSMSDL
jgi:hypothetical protein